MYRERNNMKSKRKMSVNSFCLPNLTWMFYLMTIDIVRPWSHQLTLWSVESGVAVPWCVCVEREWIASLMERLELIIGSNACCVIADEVSSARCGKRISIGKKRDAYPIYAHDVSLLHIYFVCKVYHASYMCVLECA